MTLSMNVRPSRQPSDPDLPGWLFSVSPISPSCWWLFVLYLSLWLHLVFFWQQALLPNGEDWKQIHRESSVGASWPCGWCEGEMISEHRGSGMSSTGTKCLMLQFLQIYVLIQGHTCINLRTQRVSVPTVQCVAGPAGLYPLKKRLFSLHRHTIYYIFIHLFYYLAFLSN